MQTQLKIWRPFYQTLMLPLRTIASSNFALSIVWDSIGSIDEIRIYNRALSSDEVQQLYAFEAIPQNCIGQAATATAIVVNGFLVGINITGSGCGYTNTPSLRIFGGGGTNAEAVA